MTWDGDGHPEAGQTARVPNSNPSESQDKSSKAENRQETLWHSSLTLDTDIGSASILFSRAKFPLFPLFKIGCLVRGL